MPRSNPDIPRIYLVPATLAFWTLCIALASIALAPLAVHLAKKHEWTAFGEFVLGADFIGIAFIASGAVLWLCSLVALWSTRHLRPEHATLRLLGFAIAGTFIAGAWFFLKRERLFSGDRGR